MFRKMPVILLGIALVIAFSYASIPPLCRSALYGISLTIKSLIIFILPFLIFGLLFKTAIQLAKKASTWIVFLLGAICASNFLSTMLSYAIGTFAYQLDLSMPPPVEGASLTPLGDISLPKLIGNGQAMFAGLFLGILGQWLKPVLAEKIALKLERAIALFLKYILYAIPLFIAGFIVKMIHDGQMNLILRNYTLIFALVAIAVLSYVSFIYFFVNRFEWKEGIKNIKNMLPAAIAGFGSMSSAAAMPLTILGTEKNAKNPDVARMIIPATVNIHLIGDCFSIPIFAFAILKSFGVEEPAFASYFLFACYFVLAKFSVAAVPGGGILVMLPILEAHLGFSGEMLSLITALYILFDPLITAANVLGNGAFAIGLSKLAGGNMAESIPRYVQKLGI